MKGGRQAGTSELSQFAPEVNTTLEQFVNASDFRHSGGIITDLDGTALHEKDGRIYIPKPVELGLKQLRDLGRPFVLNSLRFPLSVLRTFGRDWHNISNAPIPTVTLNGSLLGYVTQDSQGHMTFEEIAAYPLSSEEIESTLAGVQRLVDANVREVL